ncbi:MAG: hypothetical protein LC672_05325, partial [Acidobacteria bacterium]|nr:hypothetical protein [Acidobacteriota bacterium]
MSRSNTTKFIARLFSLVACIVFVGADLVASAQNANSSTTMQEDPSAQNANMSNMNMNRGGRRRGGRRRGRPMMPPADTAGTATETTATTATQTT